MIHLMEWDSEFFKRRIGRLEVDDESLESIESTLRKARDEGYKYVMCRLTRQDQRVIRCLESCGFYLTDIGVNWEVETRKFAYRPKGLCPNMRTADGNDVPALRKMAKSLFTQSRFYSDPFYSKAEADALHETWVANSVLSSAADIVFLVPNGGFVTCKKDSDDHGNIVLIGVKEGQRGQGTGGMLLAEAIEWFKSNNVSSVSARALLKNIEAMNFYSSLGFYIKEYDIGFAVIL